MTNRPTRTPGARLTLQDLRDLPTITVPEAQSMLGIGRTAAYQAIARGEIPSIHLGKRVLVPTAPLLSMPALTRTA